MSTGAYLMQNRKHPNMCSRYSTSGYSMTDSGKKDVPEYIASDLEYLESIFHVGHSLDKTIYSFFNNQPNCYTYALDLMAHSKDFMRGKSWSLTRALMDAFGEWCKKNDISRQLTKELKTKALYTVLKQPNGSLVGLVCDIFKLKEDAEHFMQIIEQLLADRKFREAFYTITALNLQRKFSLHKVVLPFFFLDKESWLRIYLRNFPDMQLQLVKTLDAISLNRQEIQELVRSLNIEGIKKHVHDTSWLQKRIAHFVDIFNINIAECPNLYEVRSTGAMGYLIRKRYTEESIAVEPWEELITSIVSDSSVLQRELIMRLVCLNDNWMALKLAKKFNINKNDWPTTLQSLDFSSTQGNDASIYKYWRFELPSEKIVPYLALRLDVADIHLVDNTEMFLSAVTDISENYDVVGVDAEWKPNLGVSKERIALLQLAVWDAVYLLDILALKNCLKQDDWDYMMSSIFYNPEIIKLGYGVQNDLRLLLKIFQEERARSQKYSRIIDTGDFFAQVRKQYPAIKEHLVDIDAPNEIKSEDYKGLSQLCVIILGKPLNKEEQFSDWERRPLRDKQKTYAALDAFCLLLIYEKLFHILRKMKLNFDELAVIFLSPKPKSPKKGKKENKSVKIQHQPSRINTLKVVVDNMLHGLGKYLRVCGADVIMLRSNEDHMNALKIAQADGRLILSSGGPYQKLKGYMPEDMCFYVPDSMHAKDQAAYVLNHFNIQISEADIFSRCTVCNGNSYIKVPSEDLYTLWSNQDSSQEQNSSELETADSEVEPYFIYGNGFITEKGILHTDVPIQLRSLSSQVFQRIKLFFVCSKCGKVYWEGSHFERIKKHISNYVTLSASDGGNIYQVLPKEKNEDASKDVINNCESNHEPALQSTAQALNAKEYMASNSPEDIEPCTFNSQKHSNILHFDVDSSSDDDIVYCD